MTVDKDVVLKKGVGTHDFLNDIEVWEPLKLAFMCARMWECCFPTITPMMVDFSSN